MASASDLHRRGRSSGPHILSLLRLQFRLCHKLKPAAHNALDRRNRPSPLPARGRMLLRRRGMQHKTELKILKPVAPSISYPLLSRKLPSPERGREFSLYAGVCAALPESFNFQIFRGFFSAPGSYSAPRSGKIQRSSVKRRFRFSIAPLSSFLL
jgi:hypothetical protein